MKPIDIGTVSSYVEQNIGIFHDKRLQSLEKFKLHTVLKRKNPYLFKAKYILTAEQLVRNIMDAYLSSQEETLFGDWLEGLAIFINNQVFGGYKSGITGIDLEFEHNEIRYLVTIKSGPNWGNSSQIAKMVSDFQRAKKTLRTSNARIRVVAVNGCCYGRETNPDKGEYLKYCGQQFWSFVSGSEDLYIQIIEPLGHRAKEMNDNFMEAYAQVVNRFTKQFINEFCHANGAINWEKVVRFNSSEKE